MSQKLAVDVFRSRKNINKFNEDFIKSSDLNTDKGYILEVDL